MNENNFYLFSIFGKIVPVPVKEVESFPRWVTPSSKFMQIQTVCIRKMLVWCLYTMDIPLYICSWRWWHTLYNKLYYTGHRVDSFIRMVTKSWQLFSLHITAEFLSIYAIIIFVNVFNNVPLNTSKADYFQPRTSQLVLWNSKLFCSFILTHIWVTIISDIEELLKVMHMGSTEAICMWNGMNEENVSNKKMIVGSV